MNGKSLSVYIVNFNGLRFLKKLLSTIKQNIQPNEVVIWDNASVDNSKSFLKEQEGIKVHFSSKNIGHGPAMNEALNLCKSEIILYLDCDTYVVKGGLKEMLLTIFEDENVGVVGQRSARTRDWWYPYFHPCCFAIRRDCLKEAKFCNSGAPGETFFKALFQEKKWKFQEIQICPKFVYHYGSGSLAESLRLGVLRERDFPKYVIDRVREKYNFLHSLEELIVDGKCHPKREGGYGDMRPFAALLYGMTIALDAKVVFEIGTGWLNSTKSFLLALEKTDGQLYTCDPDPKFYSFRHPRFHFFKQKSEEVKWNDIIDLLFIDGNHEYKEAKKDFLKFESYVKEGGIIAFHDFTSREGVSKLVKEISFPRIVFPKFPGLAIFQKVKALL